MSILEGQEKNSEETVSSMTSDGDPANPQVTFQDLGIPVVQNTRSTFLGKIQTCNSLKKIELTFLIVSVISFLISLGLTIQRLITLDTESDDFTFAILLFLTTAFCLYYAIDGIFLERPYEILVCVVSTLIVIIYCILNFSVGAYNVLKLVRMIVAILLGVIVIGSGCSIAIDYHKSGDLVFRTVGGNIELQRCCSVLFAVSSLLGLDLQLEASMIIFVMRNGVTLGLLEKVVIGVGIPVAILWLILGCTAMRLENKFYSSLFLSLCWAEPAYVIFKFISLHEIRSDILKSSIIACGASAIAVRVLLIIVFVFAMRNYGKGLKEKIFGKENRGLAQTRPE